MIHIEKGQKIVENENLRVASETGDYADDALIEYFDIGNENVVIGSLQAQYIKYGSLVYQFNEPKDLGEAILKIDPESTHTSASYVRMTAILLSQMNMGSLEIDSLDKVISDEQKVTEEKKEEVQESPIVTEPVQTETQNQEIQPITNPQPEEVLPDPQNQTVEPAQIPDQEAQTQVSPESPSEDALNQASDQITMIKSKSKRKLV